uniref:Uncharacterized protein n=1 Tax=Anguilla anguilla TaxID=7936 RepID=A0A0E9TGK0_ANGAN
MCGMSETLKENSSVSLTHINNFIRVIAQGKKSCATSTQPTFPLCE